MPANLVLKNDKGLNKTIVLDCVDLVGQNIYNQVIFPQVEKIIKTVFRINMSKLEKHNYNYCVRKSIPPLIKIFSFSPEMLFCLGAFQLRNQVFGDLRPPPPFHTLPEGCSSVSKNQGLKIKAWSVLNIFFLILEP